MGSVREALSIDGQYTVSNSDGLSVDSAAEYLVLRLDLGCQDSNHFLASRKAVMAYADAIEDSQPKLADEIRIKYG